MDLERASGMQGVGPNDAGPRMRFGKLLGRYWPEILLFLAVALPWLSLGALGLLWLWEGGHVWIWAIAAGVLGLLAWPLSRSVQHRANEEARLALGDLA